MKNALFWLVLPLTLGCATAMPRANNVLTLGYTTCIERDGRVVPIAYIRLDALVSDEGKPIIAHEVSHMMNVARFASCKEYDRWLRSRDNRIESEATAFCASAQVWSGLTGTPLPVSIDKYAYWLAVGYPDLGLSVDSARVLISRGCMDPMP